MLAQIAVPVALNVGRSFANVGRSNILRVTFFVTSGIVGFANGSPVPEKVLDIKNIYCSI